MGIFTDIGSRIEAGATEQITTISANISGMLIPYVTAGITLYILFYAFAVTRGEVQEPINRFAWDTTKMSMILFLALSVGVGQGAIKSDVEIFTAKLSDAVNTSAGGSCTVSANTSTGIYEALDCSFFKITEEMMNNIKTATDLAFKDTNGIIDMVKRLAQLILYFIIWAIIFVVAMGVLAIVYALVFVEVVVLRIGLAMFWCFSPLALACLAFAPTKKYFEGWANKIAYGIVLQFMFILFMGISIGILSGYLLDSFHKWVNTNDFIYFFLTQVSALIGMIVLLIAIGFVFFMLPKYAAELTGGSSHGGIVSNMIIAAGNIARGAKALSGKFGKKGGSMDKN